MFKTFIGVDPGADGAIAIIKKDSFYSSYKFKHATEKDILEHFETFKNLENPVIYLEHVSSSPAMGVKNAFTFGQGYGFLRACCYNSGVRFVDVRPLEWQRFLKCQTGGDKKITKQRAQALFPILKVTNADADALLIAEYARQKEASLSSECQG